MSLKVRDIQVWQPSMALALVPVAIMISSKKIKNKESNAFKK